MPDILTQLYHFVDSKLPVDYYPHPAEDALTETFSPEQMELFEAYTAENVDQTDLERQKLFYFTLRMALNIP